MKDEHIQLLRETMQSLSQTTAPIWESMVRHTQIGAIVSLFLMGLAVVFAVCVTVWALRKMREDEELIPPVIFSVGFIWFGVLMLGGFIPELVATALHPEGETALRVLKGVKP